MNILQILQDDYQRFPDNQTYSIYAEDVYFRDPVFQFRGRDRYKLMIGFIKTFFINVKMDLHNIEQIGDTIRTDWTLSWNTPLPWKPHIAIDGWSELKINEHAASLEASESAIVAHVDYWKCSKLEVVKQHFRSARS